MFISLAPIRRADHSELAGGSVSVKDSWGTAMAVPQNKLSGPNHLGRIGKNPAISPGIFYKTDVTAGTAIAVPYGVLSATLLQRRTG